MKNPPVTPEEIGQSVAKIVREYKNKKHSGELDFKVNLHCGGVTEYHIYIGLDGKRLIREKNGG